MDFVVSPSGIDGKRKKSPQSSTKTANDVTDKIKELYMIMPKEIFQEHNHHESTSMTSPATEKNLKTAIPDDKKIPNKGKILTEAVTYISSLQNNVDCVNRKEVEVKNKLRELFHDMDAEGIEYRDIIQEFASKDSNLLSALKSNNTTAEILLYELMDIGPLANENGNANNSTNANDNNSSNNGNNELQQ